MGQIISYAFLNDYYSIIDYIEKYPNKLGVYKININVKNNKLETLLHHFCYTNNLEITRKLINLGHEINILNSHGHTPLYDACLNKKYNFELIKLLIEKGADIELSKKNPLFLLINNKKLFLYIYNNGINKNPINDTSNSLLHILCINNKIHLLKLVCQHEVNINILNKSDQLPIDLAIENNSHSQI